MTSKHRAIIALVGPTAIGKTALSFNIAETFSCEIIGVDSMQIYRHMDIGTAKPSSQERMRIPHHLIDIIDPDEDYSVGCYVEDAGKAVAEIQEKNLIPLLVGGSGLYLRGLLNGLSDLPVSDPIIRENLKAKILDDTGRRQLYQELLRDDPESAARIHPNDTQRVLRAMEIYQSTGITWSQHIKKHGKNPPPLSSIVKIGLTCERDVLYDRINRRVDQMIEQGFVTEVAQLLDLGYTTELKSLQSIGYRHMINHLTGQWTLPQAREMLARDTRHYAKRQYTWFKNDPQIKWFNQTQEKEILTYINTILSQSSAPL